MKTTILKSISTLALCLLPLTTMANAKYFDISKYVGKYEGIDNGNKPCTVKIEKYIPWLPTRYEQYEVSYTTDEIQNSKNWWNNPSMIVPKVLDTDSSGDGFYYQSKVDAYNQDFSGNLINDSENKPPSLLGIRIKTVATQGSDFTCWQLKKLKD